MYDACLLVIIVTHTPNTPPTPLCGPPVRFSYVSQKKKKKKNKKEKREESENKRGGAAQQKQKKKNKLKQTNQKYN